MGRAFAVNRFRTARDMTMCELMAIAAAVAFTAVHFRSRRGGKLRSASFTTALMFWGAAIMWGVDCVANAMEGEALLDVSVGDSVLGAIVVVAGLAVFALLMLLGRCNDVRGEVS